MSIGSKNSKDRDARRAEAMKLSAASLGPKDPKKSAVTATPGETSQAQQSKGRAANFQRQLKEMPGLAAREAAAAGALAYGRGKGRGGAMLSGLRGVGLTGEAARGQAALEATELSEKASKKTAGQKQMIMQEIENLRKAKRHDKDSVLALSYLAEGDAALVEFLQKQADSAPNKSESAKEGDRNLGSDIKDGISYLKFW